MILRQWNRKVDAKGRFQFPAKVRAELKEGGVLAIDQEGEVRLYLQAGWERLRESKEGFQNFIDFIISSQAERIVLDGVGRLLIPQFFRRKLGKRIVIIGFEDGFLIQPGEEQEVSARRKAKEIRVEIPQSNITGEVAQELRRRDLSIVGDGDKKAVILKLK